MENDYLLALMKLNEYVLTEEDYIQAELLGLDLEKYEDYEIFLRINGK